ncbi:carbonate dehydratase [Seongchinamella unica]|uniref:Carbonic anhydrase n=1 Tax=Seongchinamella unica TaxID=2547392 RepID=A0A4R5LUI2_9GAMM|nr:carbonate dehydratase [Seongchinamella unica]TDG15049.1 carbonate dehydratase [Seongchinamella unica]
MPDTLDKLFHNNRSWADTVKTDDPGFFEKLAGQQSPEYLWIGCSDSRVPANQVVGLMPGEVFVHRNVANLVVHSDFNCLSVLQYAVEVLQVKYVMVVGHYGCGGVQAAYENGDNGLVDNWLRHVKDVIHRHRAELDAIADQEARVARLCELNVQAQVANVCSTTIVQNAWSRNQRLSVHGWIYGLRDGLLKDLGCTVSGADQIAAAYRVES